MSRPLSPMSKQILVKLSSFEPLMLHKIYELFGKEFSKKAIYDTLFRLVQQGLLKVDQDRYHTTDVGKVLLHTIDRKRDGVWKIVIFDIPESKRHVRTVLRSKLTSIGFKKWQNSIWVSPYIIAPEIEAEFNELANHFFVRLIKTSDINFTQDLEEIFA